MQGCGCLWMLSQMNGCHAQICAALGPLPCLALDKSYPTAFSMQGKKYDSEVPPYNVDPFMSSAVVE